MRSIKRDDAYISPMTGRDGVTISLHHNAGLRFWDYFQAIEPIFLKYGGRPHWGNKHTQKVESLMGMYPQWNKFQEVRQKFDPEGTFLTPYMCKLLTNSP